jgi:hypothetical protein
MSERAQKIRSDPHKEFNNFSELNRWVNSELANKLYKIGMIDWEECIVEVHGRDIGWK